MKILKLFGLTTQTEAENAINETYKKVEEKNSMKIKELKRHYEQELAERMTDAEIEVYVQHIKDDKNNLKNQVTELKNRIRTLNGQNGGLVASNNKLRKENNDLQEEIKILKSGAYLRKKLPSGRIPSIAKPKIKSSSKQSQIIKQYYEGK